LAFPVERDLVWIGEALIVELVLADSVEQHGALAIGQAIIPGVLADGRGERDQGVGVGDDGFDLVDELTEG
jgi:hypothetical protein